jgi:hypothetical protein
MEFHLILLDEAWTKVTTHVVRLKLFRLKAEGGRKARFPYFGGNIWFLHQRWLQNALFPNGLQPIHLSITDQIPFPFLRGIGLTGRRHWDSDQRFAYSTRDRFMEVETVKLKLWKLSMEFCGRNNHGFSGRPQRGWKDPAGKTLAGKKRMYATLFYLG